jgi:ABC-2 type transport system ATP-binding protein
MIQTTDLRVDYDDVTAVRDLCLSIPRGEIFGLIGPNGAGKTSTIRVLATLLKPTYGEVRIAGVDILENPSAIHRTLGYMPDTPPVYKDLKCWEFLSLFAATYFVERRVRRRRIDDCLALVDLESKRDTLAGKLSAGMKQRLVLAKTLLPEPEVLLLDEPASGLDPIARIEMRQILKQLAAMGRTVLISSHILTELSEFCTSIGIMEKGRLVVAGRIGEIIERLDRHKRIVVELLEGDETVATWLGGLEEIRSLERKDGRLEFDFTGDDRAAAALLRRLIEQGAAVKGFHERRMGVEDILLEVGAREVS